MLRLFLILLLLIPVSWGVLWLADHPGTVTIDWMGWRIHTYLAVLLAALVLGLMLLSMVLRSIFYVLGAPRRVKHRIKLRRQQEGLDALTRAFTALSISDLREADRHASKAKKLLDKAPITHLLSAQIARSKGETKLTRAELQHMLEADTTKAVAWRGLIEHAMHDSNIAGALRMAEEAFAERPQDRWLTIVLLDLYVRQQDWEQAQMVIREARRHHSLDKEERQHYLAIIYYFEAKEQLKALHPDDAIKLAYKAHKQTHSFLPAAIMLARLYVKNGQRQKLPSLIHEMWAQTPHPKLAKLYLDSFGDESANRLTKRFEKLSAQNPDHVESQIALASMAMHIQQWDMARNHLKAALSVQESQRIFQMMATVEKEELGDEQQAAQWIRRAVHAPKDAEWVCANCHHTQDTWFAHCPRCEAFDSADWSTLNSHILMAEDSRRFLPE